MGSNSLELAVQLLAGKCQDGGSAVRTMMIVLDKVPAVEQRFDFGGCQSIAKLHCSFASEHVE